MENLIPPEVPFELGPHRFQSRLFLGTGKYASYAEMRDALALSGTECVTVAVRRIPEGEAQGEQFLDFIDRERYTLLPNTAGCFDAELAIRTARLSREMLDTDLVKLEVLGDKKTLLPDPQATLYATEALVNDGFTVLVYTSDDVIQAQRLESAGATAVMPAGSPIGSGQGILNPLNISLILETLNVPVIVDAGVGTASDVAIAMELGAEGVLLNTGVASAKEPLRMARAMKAACEAGRDAWLSGRIPKKRYAMASSPEPGVLGTPV
ncbi:MAG TPA: thiazole synthase [Planctomycetota bacterium]|nr:thiazole synthase [Planctomycetota bacterium]MDP7246353.1 thiazole synthase [Planctomycetota bacterium]HJM40155.1 thiazole synthase [Planctomycetota bacterium]